MIKVENLSYAYKKNNKVLENISFEIQDGEIVLLLGINGVGKTTLLKCISGLLPTKHCITFDGEEVWDYAELAFISEESIAFPHWKVERYGAFLQSQYAKFSIERFWNLLEFFSIDKNKKIHTLSKGQKMKLEVAAFGGILRNTEFGAEVELEILMPEAQAQPFLDRLTDMTSGTVEGMETGQEYRAFPVE